MSVEPPSSGRPTGPPSGPLSGPSQPSPTQPVDVPPAGPPSGASGAGAGGGDTGGGGTGGGGTGGGGAGGPEGPGGAAPGPGQPGGGGPDRPWWRSAPRVALITGVVAAAVILGLVFTNNGGGTKNAGSEVFLQSADKAGPDPFTESTANDTSAAPTNPATPATSAPANATVAVSGNAPGLYGGTRDVSSCDVEKQISVLTADPAKNKAFASVEGIQPDAVPAYLRSLTPVQLRLDTRVTNHGYRNGAPTSFQSVLQTGTAVLVDSRGVPRVRCACGNPLLPPVAQKGTPKATGDSWPGYRSRDVVVVAPSTTVINVFVLYDPENNEWIARHRGNDVHKDKKTHPPVNPSPSASVSGSASPCVSPGGSKPGSGSPCPSTATSPSSGSSSPSTSSASSEPPSSAPPSSAPPEPPSSQPASPASEAPPASGPASSAGSSAEAPAS